MHRNRINSTIWLILKIIAIFIIISFYSYKIFEYSYLWSSKPKVSVVIPCYNSEIYLPSLFMMFKEQTLKNYELIFVDDGSTDKTNSLIKEQQSKDKRIKLISIKNNTGAGNARNVGLSEATGDYIIFLDSDDIFYPNLLKTSYKLAKKHDVDILLFNFECLYELVFSCDNYTSKYLWEKPYPINEVFTPNDVKDNLFTFSRGMPWNKLYKRDFINKNNLHFLNLKIHNDSYFVYTSYIVANKMYITDEKLLIYRYHDHNSITTNQKKYKRESIKTNIRELKKFLIEKKLLKQYENALQKIINNF